MKNKGKGILNTGIVIAIVAMLAFFVVPMFTDTNSFGLSPNKVENITYSKFMKSIKDKEIESVNYYNTDISQYFNVDVTYTNGKKATLTTPLESTTINKLVDQNASVKFNKFQDVWGSVIGAVVTLVLPVVLLIAGWSWLMKRGGGAGMGSSISDSTKSSAKRFDKTKDKVVKFSDVSGYEEEKFELQEFAEFLNNTKKYTDMGASIPKGVLLSGPPGTGKTLLARAVAGEAGVPFFSIAGSEFMQMFVGAGASKVRDLFEKAKKEAPSIIFIDEIDSIGKKRGVSAPGGGSDGREEIINQLLVNMDGFDNETGVIVMAATNRVDILDPALTRPGRFDRKIEVNLPDYKSRLAILKLYAEKTHLDPKVDLVHFAKSTFGFSGAMLKNIINEAAILAVRENRRVVTEKDMDEALDRTILGPAKKSKDVAATEKTIVAFHEAGHALLGVVKNKSEFVQKVTIIPRGSAGGIALHSKKEDRGIETFAELSESIMGMLGGRVAEKIIFNHTSSGASNDIMQATNTARAMVYELGMSSMGPIQFFDRNDPYAQKMYSDETNKKLDEEVSKIIDDAEKEAYNTLIKYKEELNDLAKALIEKETLNANEILEVLGMDENGEKLPKPISDLFN